jgi:hypothetical protein
VESNEVQVLAAGMPKTSQTQFNTTTNLEEAKLRGKTYILILLVVLSSS